jgi:hypothetical protein
MKGTKLFAYALVGAVGLFTVAGCATNGEATKEAKDAKPAGQVEMKLPPGWTEADMQACMMAGTPGEMHKKLAQGVGEWRGKNTMWMGPGGEPVTTDCTTSVKPMMDGRYVKLEMAGEMPGMGPYRGFGIYGFDNVSQKFVATWIDNHSTGIMRGEGEMSSDGKTITTNYTYNCPINKKPVVMREVETITGPNTRTLEMFGADPKSGQEYKMMSIELTRK